MGVGNGDIDALAKDWRRTLGLDERLELANALWGTNTHEARVCAAKLLTQARIKPNDTAAWALIASWVPDFDGWAIADHAMMAGQRRLTAQPARLADITPWVGSDHMWTKRAAMVITLPFARQRDPKPFELDIRETVLGWAAQYVDDKAWFIQKSVSWWLRELSRKDPARVRAFMADHGDKMKGFARKDATRLLPAVE